MSVLIKEMIPLKKILPLNTKAAIRIEEDDIPKGCTAKETTVRNEPMDWPSRSEPTAGPSKLQQKPNYEPSADPSRIEHLVQAGMVYDHSSILDPAAMDADDFVVGLVATTDFNRQAEVKLNGQILEDMIRKAGLFTL